MSAQTIEDNLKASTLVTVPEVTVCETTLSCKLTVEEYAKLEDYEAEHDLIGLRVKLDRFRREIDGVQRNSTPPEYRALQKEIDDLEKAQAEKLKERRQKPETWTKKDRAYVAQLERSISEAQDELDAIPIDEATVLKRTDAMMKDLRTFQRHQIEFYLEFAHSLAVSRKLTKAKLETWRKDAKAEDFKAANQLVSVGKRLHSQDGALPPLPDMTKTEDLKN